ncbi:DoxX-like family protein [Acinetobacter nosocomialis]|uniref:DoxX-like family protein n=1 Tax=Acinetobacter nosocomialis TaxID=106654 RepID=UPI0019633CBA|nr:DoxX-like family protein [Acinetobacter nosocomialis]MBM9559092.1 DoxX-like family protein [Acinetobacter nosocomialis]MBR7731215.1 DoxX-like family protein [Acinetobacter nosocomialis]
MGNAKALKFINFVLAFLWIYQGVVPKIIFINSDEISVWQMIGLSFDYAKLAGRGSGIAEVIFGLLFLFSPHKYIHYLSILGLLDLLLLIGFLIPSTLISPYNPIVMNISMISLSIIYLLLLKEQTAHL